MNKLDFGVCFHSHEELLSAKRDYEEISKTVLTFSKAECLKSTVWMSPKFRYQRFTLSCKAGRERKCKSKGLLKSSTIEKWPLLSAALRLHNVKLFWMFWWKWHTLAARQNTTICIRNCVTWSFQGSSNISTKIGTQSETNGYFTARMSGTISWTIQTTEWKASIKK